MLYFCKKKKIAFLSDIFQIWGLVFRTGMTTWTSQQGSLALRGDGDVGGCISATGTTVWLGLQADLQDKHNHDEPQAPRSPKLRARHQQQQHHGLSLHLESK